MHLAHRVTNLCSKLIQVLKRLTWSTVLHERLRIKNRFHVFCNLFIFFDKHFFKAICAGICSIRRCKNVELGIELGVHFTDLNGANKFGFTDNGCRFILSHKCICSLLNLDPDETVEKFFFHLLIFYNLAYQVEFTHLWVG